MAKTIGLTFNKNKKSGGRRNSTPENKAPDNNNAQQTPSAKVTQQPEDK